jgi:cytochrome c553
MKAVLSAATDSEMANMALFYATQKPVRTPTSAAGDQAAGKAAATACDACHGASGVGTDPATPNLAGQDAQYLAAALTAYKDGSRADTTMKALASSLDEAAARNLAAFYTNQQPQQPKVNRPLTTIEWVQRCDRCHGADGNSTDPRMPALAGQRADYLEKVLQAYRSGERKSSQMAAMSGVLTAADVESLADFYARQKSRSVVYVVIQAK